MPRECLLDLDGPVSPAYLRRMQQDGGTSLAEFLERLTNDESYYSEYVGDPITTLATSGLSPSDIKLIQRGSVQEIRDALAGGETQAYFIVRFVIGLLRSQDETPDGGTSAQAE
jgi:hypothetical protein